MAQLGGVHVSRNDDMHESKWHAQASKAIRRPLVEFEF